MLIGPLVARDLAQEHYRLFGYFSSVSARILWATASMWVESEQAHEPTQGVEPSV